MPNVIHIDLVRIHKLFLKKIRSKSIGLYPYFQHVGGDKSPRSSYMITFYNIFQMIVFYGTQSSSGWMRSGINRKGRKAAKVVPFFEIEWVWAFFFYFTEFDPFYGKQVRLKLTITRFSDQKHLKPKLQTSFNHYNLFPKPWQTKSD